MWLIVCCFIASVLLGMALWSITHIDRPEETRAESSKEPEDLLQ